MERKAREAGALSCLADAAYSSDHFRCYEFKARTAGRPHVTVRLPAACQFWGCTCWGLAPAGLQQGDFTAGFIKGRPCQRACSARMTAGLTVKAPSGSVGPTAGSTRPWILYKQLSWDQCGVRLCSPRIQAYSPDAWICIETFTWRLTGRHWCPGEALPQEPSARCGPGHCPGSVLQRAVHLAAALRCLALTGPPTLCWATCAVPHLFSFVAQGCLPCL